jgi:hypothetical protein
VVVGELGAIDPRFALAAHVDEHVLVADLDHAAFHDLTALEGAPRLVLREEGGEIFFGICIGHQETE